MRLFLLYFFFFFFFSGCVSLGDMEFDESFKIGIILPGEPLISRTEPVRDLYYFTSNKINSEGGILGKDVELIYYYSNCSFEGGKKAMNYFIDNNIKFVVGGICSEETLGAAFVSGNFGDVILLSPTSRSSRIIDKGNLVFSILPTFKKSAQVLFEQIKSDGNKNVALIYHKSEFTNDFIFEFKKLFKNYSFISYEDSLKAFNSNYEYDFLKGLNSSNSNLDSILILIHNEEFTNFTLNLIDEKLGFDLDIYSNSLLFFPGTFENFYGDLKGTKFTNVDLNIDKNLSNKFKSEFMEKYPDSKLFSFPYFYVASNYESLFILKKVIDFCGKIDTDCVKGELSNLDYSNVIKNLSFNVDGSSNQNVKVYTFE